MLYLKKLSDTDGIEIYNMLQEILPNDNGFHNKAYGMTFKQYQKWVKREFSVDNGNLESWMVPQTSYWLYDDDTPIGYGRIRHYLNENLEKTSGHIGYAIRQTKRGYGYGNKILSLLLAECKKLNIINVQIGANEDNVLSNKVIKNNGGVLFRNSGNKNFYRICLEEENCNPDTSE